MEESILSTRAKTALGFFMAQIALRRAKSRVEKCLRSPDPRAALEVCLSEIEGAERLVSMVSESELAELTRGEIAEFEAALQDSLAQVGGTDQLEESVLQDMRKRIGPGKHGGPDVH